MRGKEKIAYGVDDAILQARVLDAVFRSANPASGRSRQPQTGASGGGGASPDLPGEVAEGGALADELDAEEEAEQPQRDLVRLA